MHVHSLLSCSKVGLCLLLIALGGCKPDPSPSHGGVALVLPAPGTQGRAKHDPALVMDVCGRPQTYTDIPQRAVTHDVNITEMFLFLGLGDKLVAYSGIPSQKEILPNLRPLLEHVPSLSTQETNIEAIVDVHADFVFGGWSYGFRPGGVTPELLASHGIQSYVLSESCIRIQPREGVDLGDVELDLKKVARIFGVEEQAKAQIAQLETSRKKLEIQMRGNQVTPRIFIFDSGDKIPLTAGRYGMPHAILEAAGAKNIFDDIPSNWPSGNWEDVIARDPDWIVIVDYGVPSAQGKMDFLLGKPELASVNAIRKRRFFVMSYAEATPGPRSVQVAQKLAAALHPERNVSVDALTWPPTATAPRHP